MPPIATNRSPNHFEMHSRRCPRCFYHSFPTFLDRRSIIYFGQQNRMLIYRINIDFYIFAKKEQILVKSVSKKHDKYFDFFKLYVLVQSLANLHNYILLYFQICIPFDLNYEIMVDVFQYQF